MSTDNLEEVMDLRILAVEAHIDPAFRWMGAKENDRRREFVEAFDRAIEVALDEKADALILPGDLFHSPKPSWTSICRVARALKEARRRGVEVYSIPGNHDRYREEGRKGPIDFLGASGLAKNLHSDSGAVISRFREGPKEIAVVGLGFIPFLSEHEDPLERFLPKNQPEGCDGTILITHYTFEGFRPPPIHTAGRDPVVKLSSIPKWVDLLISGHIHKFGRICNDPAAFYVGTSERVTFAEEQDQKGFLLADYEPGREPEVQQIQYDAREMLTVELSISKGEDITRKSLSALKAVSGQEKAEEMIVRLRLLGEIGAEEFRTFDRVRMLREAGDWFYALRIDASALRPVIELERAKAVRSLEEAIRIALEELRKEEDPKLIQEAEGIVRKVLEEVGYREAA